MGVTQQAAHKMVKRAEQVTTPVVTSAPDPLAEEKAEGRVVKLTGPGSLLAIGRRLEELERPGRPRDAT